MIAMSQRSIVPSHKCLSEYDVQILLPRKTRGVPDDEITKIRNGKTKEFRHLPTVAPGPKFDPRTSVDTNNVSEGRKKLASYHQYEPDSESNGVP
jgi:hypothetical protein